MVSATRNPTALCSTHCTRTREYRALDLDKGENKRLDSFSSPAWFVGSSLSVGTEISTAFRDDNELARSKSRSASSATKHEWSPISLVGQIYHNRITYWVL